MGDFPGMAAEIEERARVAAVEGLRWLAYDFCAVRACLLDDLVYLFARANIVREDDATPTRAVVGDSGVFREFLPSPAAVLPKMPGFFARRGRSVFSGAPSKETVQLGSLAPMRPHQRRRRTHRRGSGLLLSESAMKSRSERSS